MCSWSAGLSSRTSFWIAPRRSTCGSSTTPDWPIFGRLLQWQRRRGARRNGNGRTSQVLGHAARARRRPYPTK
eukprot:4296466-Pyramimonas_sp.AAC.1